MPESDHIVVSVRGVSAHASTPEEGINPIEIISAFEEIEDSEYISGEVSFAAGHATNSVPKEMFFDIPVDPARYDELSEKLEKELDRGFARQDFEGDYLILDPFEIEVDGKSYTVQKLHSSGVEDKSVFYLSDSDTGELTYDGTKTELEKVAEFLGPDGSRLEGHNKRTVEVREPTYSDSGLSYEMEVIDF